MNESFRGHGIFFHFEQLKNHFVYQAVEVALNTAILLAVSNQQEPIIVQIEPSLKRHICDWDQV